MRRSSFAALLFLLGGAAGIPVGFCLSQPAPQMRVQVLLHARDVALQARDVDQRGGGGEGGQAHRDGGELPPS